MKTWNRSIMIAVPAVLALVLSALAVRPALADDNPLPPSDAPAGVVSPPVMSQGAPAQPLAGAAKQSAADDSRRAAPLARQQAVEIAVTGDPVWCPNGVAPRDHKSGCSHFEPSLEALVNNWVPTGNGTIWVAHGPALAWLMINGAPGQPWATAKNFSLRIQGGWNGMSGSMGLSAASPGDPYPLSTFSGVHGDRVVIQNWVGSLTLRNLTFTSATYSEANDYATLSLQTAGNITLDKVQVNSANNSDGTFKGSGALLDTRVGGGNVKVTNSQFNHNEGPGLDIETKGSVTLKNVIANLNTSGTGVLVNNTYAAGAKPVMITGAEFSGNGGRGLDLHSKGAIKLASLLATYNAGAGAWVDNSGAGILPVSVSGVNNFSGNDSYGFLVLTYGAIKLSNMTANYNGDDGVSLSNRYGPSAQPVTILGSLTAMYNTGNGLDLGSKGKVTATHLTAGYNTEIGAAIDNCYVVGPTCTGSGAVVFTGSNVFNHNGWQGLNIRSRGAVTLSNLTALRNGFAHDAPGVYVRNAYITAVPSPVTIKGSNVFGTNGKEGLFILSYGAVTLSNITAEGNGLGVLDNLTTGVVVDNSGGLFGKPVTITGNNVFNGSERDGLDVLSKGAIKISNITTSHNGMYGAYLHNDFATVQAKVTITGYGVFDENEYTGLEVTSHGAITLANISANYNWFDGAVLNTKGISSPQAVTLSGTNNFNLNGAAYTGVGSGLLVKADGNIKVSNINASYNQGTYGASLDNFTNWAAHLNPAFGFGSVTITGFGSFIGNNGGSAEVTGLYVKSHGSATLNHVTASFNTATFNSSGINLWVDGNAKLVCASAIRNTAPGGGTGLTLRMQAGRTLTLLGSNFKSWGNPPFDVTYTGPIPNIVQKPCP